MASTGSRARLPRFLPPDPRVEEPNLLTPRTVLRVAILGGVALIVFAVLFLRLWSLQVLSGSSYLAQANNNQLRTFPVEAPRGAILDSQGRVLVKNSVGTAVDLWPNDMPSDVGRATEILELSKLLNISVVEIQAKIHAHRDPTTPITLRVSIHPDQIAYLKEHQSHFRGVVLGESYPRYYNTQALAAQVLGYVGAISPDQLKRLASQGYASGDEIGQTGVEAAYDNYLRGVPGKEVFHVDSAGRRTSSIASNCADGCRAPQQGESVRLTIDIALQRAAEKGLQAGIAAAHADGKWAADGGAIVALDPRNGDILAMASSPTYKPSVWVGRPDAKKLAPFLNQQVAEKANFPGLDRAIQGLYPAGSTFKPVTALAALQEHLILPYQDIPCTPDYTVQGATGHGQVFKNWTTAYDQPMTLSMALATSCDTYFYQVGYLFYALPSYRGHPLQSWASRFGFGQATGLDLAGESSGLLPTPEWRQRTYTKATDPKGWQIDSLWKPGDSIQLAIGQKDLLVTPLQMTRFYAMLANGGKLVTPHVVADVEQPGGDPLHPSVIARPQTPLPQATGVDPQALAVVRDGLFQATHQPYGTSTGVFGSFRIPVAGKTGTAEKVVHLPGFTGLLDQSWWCGWAPYDKPTITVCAVIENGGHGGIAAAPAALRVFEQYFQSHASSVTGQATD